jgi:hypothetical protein
VLEVLVTGAKIGGWVESLFGFKPSIEVYAYYPSIQEAEAGGS